MNWIMRVVDIHVMIYNSLNFPIMTLQMQHYFCWKNVRIFCNALQKSFTFFQQKITVYMYDRHILNGFSS